MPRKIEPEQIQPPYPPQRDFQLPIITHDNREQSSIITIKDPSHSFSPSKPLLDQPTPSWEVIKNVARLEKTADKYAAYKEKTIENQFKKIENFHRAEALELEKAVEAKNNLTFWDTLYDLASTLTSGISLFFGFSALSTGSAALGGALVISGALSLTNIAFKHTDGWDWIANHVAQGNEEIRHAVRTYLPVAVGIAAGAMAIYGSYHAWQAAGQTALQNALSVIQGTSAIASSISAVAQGYYGSNEIWINSGISSLQTMSEIARMDLENFVEEMKDFHKKLMEVNELAGQIIQQTNHAIQLTEQTV